MIELIKYEDKERWNKTISKFLKADTYYCCEYAVSILKNETGIPYLLHYCAENVELAYVIIEKDISSFSGFENKLDVNKYYDWNTPYGYGGPVANKERLSFIEQQQFYEELFELAKSRNVVSQFVRFHPLLQNQDVCFDVIENKYVKDTIYINLETEDDLMLQMDSKNRNLIRKAMKNNVHIVHDKGNNLQEFIDIYEETMKRDNARSFYYFPKEYYKFLINNLSEQTEFFYAIKDGEIIASSIFFYTQSSIHYHLSGSSFEGRKFAPTNLLLYEAANWGRLLGCKQMHLGGGVGIEDGLFHFKKQFNKNGRIPFYIGRNIFLPKEYNELLELRKKLEPSFNIENDYYIQYRAPKE